MIWHGLFTYDESSPTGLRWRVEIRSGRNGNQVNCKPGDVAGTDGDDVRKHFIVAYGNKQFLAHRIIYEMFNGEISSDDVVDHEDGDGRNNKISNLRLVTHAVNMRNCKMRIDNKTGVTGVSKRVTRHGTVQYTASWKELDGRQRSKSFSTAVYGNDEAFRQACEYRATMLVSLNLQGAGYTERHGVA
jgi:hypothetical protein